MDRGQFVPVHIGLICKCTFKVDRKIPAIRISSLGETKDCVFLLAADLPIGLSTDQITFKLNVG